MMVFLTTFSVLADRGYGLRSVNDADVLTMKYAVCRVAATNGSLINIRHAVCAADFAICQYHY